MRRLTAFVVAGGAALVLAAAGLAAIGGGPGTGLLGRTVAGLVGVVAVLAALVTVGTSAAGRPLVETPPEQSRRDRPLAGREFAAAVDDAAATAREKGSVEAGVEAARPALRETLVAVLARSGEDPDSARATVDRGTWTDDRVAAAALSPTVEGPARSRRRRLLDWLHPERAVRRRVGRTTAAVAAVADERLPAVPGRDAPRPAPVSRPSLADMRRAADGTLETAVDPGAIGAESTGDAGTEGSSETTGRRDSAATDGPAAGTEQGGESA